MAGSSDFQAVDLDAVLDEFESSQNLDQEQVEMMNENSSTSVMKPNILEDLKPASSTLEVTKNEIIGETTVVASPVDKEETESVTSNPQPDVLSGLENVSISQHLESNDDVHHDTESKSSSSGI